MLSRLGLSALESAEGAQGQVLNSASMHNSGLDPFFMTLSFLILFIIKKYRQLG